MSPTVSVIIPTFNRAHLIGETIQSVINQTFTDWEMIIVDDGSIDLTEDVVSKFSDNRIQYFKIDHNGIFGFVRNQGIKKAKGEYIAFLDSDDLWLPTKLEVQLFLLQKYSTGMFVFSNIEIIGASQVVTPDYEKMFVGNVLLALLKEKRFVFYPSSLLFRKKILDEIGLMNETLLSGSDMNFIFSVSARYSGIFTNERLTKIRKHEHSTSDSHGPLPFVDGISNVEYLYRDGFVPKKTRDFFVGTYYYRMGLYYLKQSMSIEARESFLKQISHRPLYWKGWIRLIQTAWSAF